LAGLLTACVINMLAVSTIFMTQSIFLELSEAYRIDITQARFSFSIVSLFYAIAFFFLGPIADKFDLPKMAVAGIVLLASAVGYASLTTEFSTFIIAMAITGTCAALIPASMFPHIALVAPEEKTGVYVGTIVASGTVGVVFGRTLVGILTEQFGWQISFRVISGLLLIFAFFTVVTLVNRSNTRASSEKKLSRLYANSIKLLLSIKTLSLLLAGFLLFIGFLGMITFLTYRLVEPPFNFTSGEIGWISLAGLTALVAPFAGSLSQRVGVFRIIFPGLLICLISLQLLGWCTSVHLVIIGLLLLFISVYSCQPLIFLLIGQTVPRSSLGSASSLYILFCIGGGSLSSVILGPIWKSFGWAGITIVCSVSLALAIAVLVGKVWYERRTEAEVAQ
jgi:YNFM family putative membrane transporter